MLIEYIIKMDILNILKKLPIDLGQAELKHKTKGKLLGFSYIKKALQNNAALDIGCRDGYWSKRLLAKGYNVKSIDIEPHYRPAKQVDINKGLPFENNSFNVIWCSEVIEHLNNPQESIKEMIRVAKDKATIVLTTPNSYFWIMKIFYFFGCKPQKMQNPGHKYFFDFKKLKRILPARAKVMGFFPYLIIKKEIKKLVGLLSPTFIIIIKVNK